MSLVSAILPAEASAEEPYKKGDPMVAIALEDQHGEAAKIDASTRLVLFTRDMDAGDTVKAALAERRTADLEALGLVYAADISGMPGLVRRMFAVPAMRKRGYSMLLDIKGEATQRFPGEPGRATLIALEDLEVTSIRFLASVDEIQQLFIARAER
jgi:NADPH-dependent ferric siderophore reductase